MSILLGAALAAAMASGQDYAQQRVAPRGGYTQSCSEAYVNRGRLYADCRDMRGRMRGTSIELNRCGNYEIRNNDGLLVCGPVRGEYEDRPGRPGGPGNGGPGNGGGWGGRSSITVYRDADYRGGNLTFQDGVPNLANSGLNDRISSMQLRGAWEVCTDAYYRGTCRVFQGDVRNLNNSGLNDRISSLRPAGRGNGGRW